MLMPTSPASRTKRLFAGGGGFNIDVKSPDKRRRWQRPARKRKMNIDAMYNSVSNSAMGLSMSSLWQHIYIECVGNSENYSLRFDFFFLTLERLMKEERIKLASDRHFLPGTVEQQIQMMKDAWPPYPSDDELNDLDDTGLWFLAKSPAGIVWILPDGREIWT